MKKSAKIASGFIKQVTISERYGWPPVCYGTLYQPERPNKIAAKSPSYLHALVICYFQKHPGYSQIGI